MDFVDGVAVRHAVASTGLNIRHSVELLPSSVSVAEESRYCTTSIVKSVLGLPALDKQSPRPEA